MNKDFKDTIPNNSTVTAYDTNINYEKPISNRKKEGYNYYPNSKELRLAEDVLISGKKGIDTYKQRKSTINHNTKIDMLAKGDTRKIKCITDKEEVKLEVSDIKKLTEQAKTIFRISLLEANKHNIANGHLYDNKVSIPLESFIDRSKNYSTLESALESARIKAKKGASALAGNIKIGGKNKANGNEALQVLFTGYYIDNNTLYMTLNQDINYQKLVNNYFSIIPSYFVLLSNKACDLLFYVGSQVRINKKKIANEGYLNIKISTIANILALPSIENCKDIKGKIINVIENAVEDIEEKGEGKDIRFTFKGYDYATATAREIYNKGYLQIEVLGYYAEELTKIHVAQDKKIKENIKKSEKKKEQFNNILIDKATDKIVKEKTSKSLVDALFYTDAINNEES